jgi:hypothetical protein
MNRCPYCGSDQHIVVGRGRGRAQWRRCGICYTAYLYNPDRTPQQGVRRTIIKKVRTVSPEGSRATEKGGGQSLKIA